MKPTSRAHLVALTRQSFLKGAGAVAASPLLWPCCQGHAATVVSTVEIASGIYVHQGRHALFSPENQGDIANCCFVVGGEAVAVIDTGGSAAVGAGLRAAVRAVTEKPIRYVVNTHMHPDHVFGNAAFEAEDPAFVAHHKMARGLAARAEHYIAINRTLLGEAAFAGTRIVLPTLDVRDRLELDLGGRKLILETQRTAHTDNDLTILEPGTGTLFLGDLLFSGHVPTLDGSIRGWLAVIEQLRQRPAERVVPGHGPPSMSWPEALEPLRRYLALIESDVRRLIREGRTLSEAAQIASLAEKDAWLLFPDYHARNVSAAFAELEWE